MCIVADSAKLSKTKIFSYQKSEQTHGFLYSNNVASTVSNNAMILPIPCREQEAVKLYDGTQYKPFLDLFYTLFYVPPTSMKRSISSEMRVEQVGAYKVTFINYVALEPFLENANFNIQKDMINFLMNHYKNWVFTICEWQGTEPISTQPIHIEFDTMFRSDLYFPMMDGHKIAPQEGKIERDHILGFSTLNHKGHYSHISSPAPNKTFEGYKVKEWSKNGDSWMNLDAELSTSLLNGTLIKTSFEMP
jgi:hypothetical protein